MAARNGPSRERVAKVSETAGYLPIRPQKEQSMREDVKVGYQAFVSDGGDEFGAVRQVSPNGEPVLVIYVENAGTFSFRSKRLLPSTLRRWFSSAASWTCGFGGRSGMPTMRRSRASSR